MLSIRPQIAKVAKSKEFVYFPRFYDERKEKLAETERLIRKEEEDKIKGDKKVREYHFRSAMSNRWRGEDYDNTVRKSNALILLLIGGFIMIGFYVYKKFDLIELWLQQ